MAGRPPSEGDGLGKKVGVTAAVLDNARFKPLELYYDLVLDDLSSRCHDLGVRLVLVHLVPPVEKSWPERDRAQAKLQTSLEAIAESHAIELVDTTAFFAGHTEWILPGDGHLNPTGNRELADFLQITLKIAGKPEPRRQQVDSVRLP